MTNLKFSISNKNGFNFSKLSGDNNRIHLNEIEGYNSQYGEMIVHGVLIILKTLDKFKIKKKISKISINFNKHGSYRYEFQKKIYFYKKYILIKVQQNKYTICDIKIFFGKINNEDLQIKKYKKKNTILNPKRRKFGQLKDEVVTSLCYLTKYVGTIYPGKYSVIKTIDIIISDKLNKSYLTCSSKIKKRGFALIENQLIYKNIIINFTTLKRPYLKIKLKKPSQNIVNQIKKIKNNILIIGSSSGIGFDILDLLKNNKNIKIFATYNKNKKNLSKFKNINILKISLPRDENKIFDFLKQKNKINIYYCASPKIEIYNNSLNKKKELNYFFYNIVKKIIKIIYSKNINFFYPSTNFINDKQKTNYSIIKFKCEKFIENKQNSRGNLNFFRLSKINTKQNLSLIDNKLPNFRDILENNKNLQNNFFFKN